jgi:hypothetical protein
MDCLSDCHLSDCYLTAMLPCAHLSMFQVNKQAYFANRVEYFTYMSFIRTAPNVCEPVDPFAKNFHSNYNAHRSLEQAGTFAKPLGASFFLTRFVNKSKGCTLFTPTFDDIVSQLNVFAIVSVCKIFESVVCCLYPCRNRYL